LKKEKGYNFIMVKKIFSLWMPVVVWAMVIFYFSSIPVAKVTGSYWWDFTLKKTAHLIEYFIFFILLYRAIKNSILSSQKMAFFLAMVILIAYAFSDEIHQSFTPGREPKIRDVIIDSLGGFIGIWFLKYKLPKVSKRLLNLAKKWQIN